MDANHGVGHEFTFNNFCSGMGVYAIGENAYNKSDHGRFSFFSNNRQYTFHDGLLCLQAQKLISKNTLYILS